jgi:hypothetical protein
MGQSGSRDLGVAFRVAGRSALVTFAVVVAGQVIRAVVNEAFDGKWRVDWRLILLISGFAGVVVFIWAFVSAYFSNASGCAGRRHPRPDSIALDKPSGCHVGFVGMEYYALILNRTYVVFAGSNGLYGWKAEGPVSASRPQFFEPYQKMLDDPELMRNLGAVEDLAKLKGGFFIPGSEIAYVEASDNSKWGMGGIPHSGRNRIGLTSGGWREFILLGTVSPQAIRDSILSSSARSAASVRA